MSTTELVRVDFYGDQIEACVQDGRILVSIRRVCESLGIDTEGQRKKLKAKSWACTEEMSVQLENSSQQRVVTLIDRDSLPLWLATIDERKVDDHIRPKLIRYQREAARVLADHFLKKTEFAQAPADPIMAVGEAIVLMRRAQIEHEKKLATVEEKADRALQQSAAAQQTSERNYGWYSVLAFCKRIGRNLSVTESAKVGKTLAEKLRAIGGQPQRVADPRFGFVNLYPESLLADHFECNGLVY